MFHYIFLLIIIIFKFAFGESPCKEGENFCSRCNPQKTLCIRCEKDLLIPNDKGGCSYLKSCKIGKNNCIQCYEEENLCKICENEYYPDENGGCSYTDNCLVSEKGTCQKCKENYILIGIDNYFSEGIKICKSLNSEDLKYCERINMEDGSCLKCKPGYYLGEEDKKCTEIEYCKESIYGICKTCKDDYYLNIKENKCIKENDLFKHCKESKEGEKCDECDIGYYFDDEGKCANINYCSKQTKYGRCFKCKNGYYLSENYNSCTPEINCFSGNKDFGICDSCNWKYYLDLNNWKCISNEEDNDFKYCRKAKNICNVCTYGYEIGEDNKCSTSLNCIESINGTCIKCQEGYHLGLDNKCNNLEHCAYTNIFSQCFECEENYFYDRQNGTCILSNDNFKNCRAGYAQYNYCQECKNEFYLNQTDHLCYNNTANPEYYKCAITSSPGEECLRCIEGYYIGQKDAKCSKIEGCALSENETFCMECENNYCLNVKTGQCISNGDIYDEGEKYYYRCNRTNDEGTSCKVCQGNYTLKNGLCFDEEHCIERKDGICQACLKTINNTFCLNNDFGCVPTYNEGCLQCNNILNFYDCNKCMEGYDYDELFGSCRKIVEN